MKAFVVMALLVATSASAQQKSAAAPPAKARDCSVGCFDAVLSGDINLRFSDGALATSSPNDFSISLATGDRGIIVGRREGGPIAVGRYVLAEADANCHDNSTIPNSRDDAVMATYTHMDASAIWPHRGTLIISSIKNGHAFGSVEFEGCDIYAPSQHAKVSALFDADDRRY